MMSRALYDEFKARHISALAFMSHVYILEDNRIIAVKDRSGINPSNKEVYLKTVHQQFIDVV